MKGQGTSGTSTGLKFSCVFPIKFQSLDDSVSPDRIPGCDCRLVYTRGYTADLPATWRHDCPCLKGWQSNFDGTSFNVSMVDFNSRTDNW